MQKKGKIKVKVATSNIRGFLMGLFMYPFENIEFTYDRKSVYQVFHGYKKLLYRLYNKFDWMIPFQIIKAPDEGQDINFSYNRFLKSDQPYVIYLENPSALVNYSWRVLLKHWFSKRIKRCLHDKNLKAIICLSKACRETLPLYYEIPGHITVDTIYPMVLKDCDWNIDCVWKKAKQETIECLFVSQGFRIKGGEDVVEAILKLEKDNCSIHLTIVTTKEEISQEYIEKIEASKCIDVVGFGMNKEELAELYKKAAILLHPSRGDSFGLVVLEAMKYGCALITTDLYALKEMVSENENGYLIKPFYREWREDNIPNLQVMHHHNETILSGFLDKSLIENLYEILKELNDDRKRLGDLCVGSYEKAIHGMFSEKEIAKSWETLLEDIS